MKTAILDKNSQQSLNHEEYHIEIFEIGTHLSGNLISRNYSRKDLQDVVDTYDPSYFKAPLIFNFYAEDPHSPLGFSDSELVKSPFAFGYPERLSLNGDRLVAHFKNIAPEFIQMAKDHKILAVSASFYPENNPFNPYPGKLSLRHIAGLGSEPPAVKGMPLEFSEDSNFIDFSNFVEHSYDPCDEETLDHSCACDSVKWSLETLKRIMETQRELLIEQKGIEQADKHFPKYIIDSITNPSESFDVADISHDLETTHENLEHIEEKDINAVSNIYTSLMSHSDKINAISNGLKYSMNQIVGIKGGLLNLTSELESFIGAVSTSFSDLNDRFNYLQDLIIQSSYRGDINNVAAQEIYTDNENLNSIQSTMVNMVDKPHIYVYEQPETSDLLVGYTEMKETENLETVVTKLKEERDQEKRKNYIMHLMNFMEAQCNQHHKILPSQLEQEKQFAISLLEVYETSNPLEFSESTQIPVLEQFKQGILNRPELWQHEPQVVVDAEDVAPRNFSELELSDKARKLKEQYKKKGKNISLSDAIDKISQGEMPEEE